MLRSPESVLGSPGIGAHVPGTDAQISGIGAHGRSEPALTMGRNTHDGAAWIKNVLARRSPQATVCLDPFHVVS
jgi:hypothetical protein